MQELLHGLVHLRHLIIPPFLHISVPQVHWLDCYLIWLDEQAKLGVILPLLSAEERKSRFPNLRSYRSISPGLLKLPLIYYLLPPCQFSFPEIEIRSNSSSLWGMSTVMREQNSNSADDSINFSSGTGSECDEYEPLSDTQLEFFSKKLRRLTEFTWFFLQIVW